MSKVFMIIMTWFVISLVYVIMAMTIPVITELTDDTATELQATSNMSNYPGMLPAVQAFPLFAWFIPGAVGLAATVVELKSSKADS